MRASENAISVPGDAMLANVNRTASVPYFSTIPMGSITLPLVFDIFSRVGVADEGVDVDGLEGNGLA